jgi:hypothetical protein
MNVLTDNVIIYYINVKSSNLDLKQVIFYLEKELAERADNRITGNPVLHN